jgi:flagellar export protein FliJ
MGAFKFRLQSVLDVRQQAERESAARLAEAENRADEARTAQRALESIRESGAEAMHAAHATQTIGELRTMGYVLEHLGHHISDAQARVAAAEQVVAQARGHLTTALQARRVLSRLRDKHFENWKNEDNAQEMKQMDEFALARFARQAKTSPVLGDEESFALRAQDDAGGKSR